MEGLKKNLKYLPKDDKDRLEEAAMLYFTTKSKSANQTSLGVYRDTYRCLERCSQQTIKQPTHVDNMFSVLRVFK
jgi:hypothetical protein